MLGRSVTFGPKSVEKRPQQGNFFELTTPNPGTLKGQKPEQNLFESLKTTEGA